MPGDIIWESGIFNSSTLGCVLKNDSTDPEGDGGGVWLLVDLLPNGWPGSGWLDPSGTDFPWLVEGSGLISGVTLRVDGRLSLSLQNKLVILSCLSCFGLGERRGERLAQPDSRWGKGVGEMSVSLLREVARLEEVARFDNDLSVDLSDNPSVSSFKGIVGFDKVLSMDLSSNPIKALLVLL